MKLKDTFVTQEMDGEQVMVEAGGGFARHGAGQQSNGGVHH